MSYPYVVWACVMIVFPMLLITLYAFTTAGVGSTTFKFTLDNFAKFFTDPAFLKTLFLSLRIALMTTILCILIGYPIAYYIANSSKNKQTWLILAVTLPMWINMLVRTYAWIGILGKGGIVATFLSWFGIEDVKLLYTEGAVLVGMVYNFLPFMILQIHSSLAKMDQNLIAAATDLGATPKQTFRRVILPLSMPGVISGITLVFLPAVSTFFIPKLLGGGNFVLIGNLIENQFVSIGEWNFGSAISLIMASIIMVSIYFVRKLEAKQKEGGDDK